MQGKRLDEVFKVTGELIKRCQAVMDCKTSHASCTDLLLVVTALQEIHPCFDYIAKSGLDSAVKVSFGGYEVSLNDANLRAMLVMDLVQRTSTLLTFISSKGQSMINQLSEPSCLARANIAYLEAMISHFKTILRCVTVYMEEAVHNGGSIKDPRPGVPFKNRVRELDYAGIILLVGCLVSLIMAINFGGFTYGWKSGQIIGLFVCAGVLFTLLAVQQSWTLFVALIRRLMPVQFFRKYTIIILFVCTSASAAGVFIPIFFVPLFFQFTRGDGALDAGVRLLPLIIVFVVTISINGALMAKFGYYMPWDLLGGLLCVAGGALMYYTVQQDTSQSRVYRYTVIIGVGVGIWIQASFSMAQAIVDPENVPAAIGFITLAQSLGNTTALAIANAVFLNEAEAKVQQLLPELYVSEIQAAISGVTSGFARNLGSGVRAQVLDAIVASIGKTYVLVMTSGAVVAVLSLAMKQEKLFITSAAAGI
ncbi:hypothetical protein SLS64_013695 [Diaporthe eres]